MSVIMTVVDIVADIIVNAEECPVHVVRREHLNPEAEAMRAVAVEEMSRSVIVYEIPLARRYPVNIMIVNPEVIQHASPAGCREDWAEEGLVRISLVTVESPPPLVTLLRAALPAEGLCCGVAAEEPPLLIGCATLVPVPEEVRLDDETVELPEVLVPVELEPPLTCVEQDGKPLLMSGLYFLLNGR